MPASARPYIGGSQNNSLLNLIFGYNGFGRLTGNETGSVGGGAGGQGGSRWGATGLGRLFNSEMGGQIAWLLPAALILLAAGLVLTRRMPRTDRTPRRAHPLGRLARRDGGSFSFGQGIIHPYYTVAIAPAIGAIVGIMTTALWRRRSRIAARVPLAAAVATTTVWSVSLLARTPDWNPWLRPIVLVVGLLSAGGLLAPSGVSGVVRKAIVATGIVAALAGPAAYSVATVATIHGGAIPSAGPTVARTFGPGGHAGRAGVPGGTGAVTARPGTGAVRPDRTQLPRGEPRGERLERHRRPPERQHAEPDADSHAHGGLDSLHLGRGDRRRQSGRWLPVGHR